MPVTIHIIYRMMFSLSDIELCIWIQRPARVLVSREIDRPSRFMQYTANTQPGHEDHNERYWHACFFVFNK